MSDFIPYQGKTMPGRSLTWREKSKYILFWLSIGTAVLIAIIWVRSYWFGDYISTGSPFTQHGIAAVSGRGWAVAVLNVDTSVESRWSSTHLANRGEYVADVLSKTYLQDPVHLPCLWQRGSFVFAHGDINNPFIAFGSPFWFVFVIAGIPLWFWASWKFVGRRQV